VIKSKTHKTGYSVRLEYSLKQNDKLPLNLLYENLKMGNISQYSTGIWCYKSTGFKTAVSLINYFDEFNLFAGKYNSYLKFRKVYIMITEGKHLQDKGVKKIQKMSKSMTPLQSSCSSIYLFVFFFLASAKLDIIFDCTPLLLSSHTDIMCLIPPFVYLLPKGFLPVKTYNNPETQKLDILKENREKSGIYLWENKINGNFYVGSSTNLSLRLIKYFNSNHLLNYANMNICNALLKHGHPNFSLYVLEYCESDKCLQREQYYIDLLNPPYNILRIAGSSLGYKHSEKAKGKIVKSKKDKTHSAEWIANFVASVKGRKSPMKDKKHTENTLIKMSEAKKGKKHFLYGKVRRFIAGSPTIEIIVKNVLCNNCTTYSSITEAATALGIKQSTISSYLSRNQQSPYKGRFVFIKRKGV